MENDPHQEQGNVQRSDDEFASALIDSLVFMSGAQYVTDFRATAVNNRGPNRNRASKRQRATVSESSMKRKKATVHCSSSNQSDSGDETTTVETCCTQNSHASIDLELNLDSDDFCWPSWCDDGDGFAKMSLLDCPENACSVQVNVDEPSRDVVAESAVTEVSSQKAVLETSQVVAPVGLVNGGDMIGLTVSAFQVSE
jgi:hypothetical protein